MISHKCVFNRDFGGPTVGVMSLDKPYSYQLNNPLSPSRKVSLQMMSVSDRRGGGQRLRATWWTLRGAEEPSAASGAPYNLLSDGGALCSADAGR